VPEQEEKLSTKPEGPEKYKYDMLRYKQELERERQARIEVEQRAKTEEMARLEREKNYEKLAEFYKKQADENEQRYKGILESQVDFYKTNAVETELIKLGIKPDYLAFAKRELEMSSDVEIETTTLGNVNVHGARTFAENFKNRYPDVFKGLGKPNINNASPNMGGSKTWTADEVLALEKGDPVQYKKALQEYSQQMKKR
jgi:hypothetical protein